MSKRQSRGRAGNGNREMYDAMMGLRRSSAASKHRDRSKYNRNDAKRASRQEW